MLRLPAADLKIILVFLECIKSIMEKHPLQQPKHRLHKARLNEDTPALQSMLLNRAGDKYYCALSIAIKPEQ